MTVHRKPDRMQPARHYEGATHAPCFFCGENGHNLENCRHGQKIVCHACHCLSTVWRNNPASKARSEMLSSDNDVTIDLDSLTKSIMKPGLKIGCLNIRGLLGKKDELSTILKKCLFDVMCVCETFIDYNVAHDEIIIQGYSVELRNRNRHGGGVLIYVKDGIKYTKITDLTSTLVESTWINIKQLAVGVMYRPPSSDVEYFTNMLDQLDHIYSKYDNVILLGYLNYDCVSGVRIVTNPL